MFWLRKTSILYWLSGKREEMWTNYDGNATRVIKHCFELCVLQKLEKALN
jgi:hypothetical protein